jgi:N6-adenosine-specific RNA methylase IME4
MSPTIKVIPISKIKIPHRLRQLDLEKVDEIAESISQIGLLHPIIVDKKNKLISGSHRLEAYKNLNYKTIPASIVDLSKLKTSLAEIDENLKRNELSVLEVGEHLINRESILEQMGVRAKQGDNRFTDRGEMDYTSTKLADEMGFSKRSYLQRKQIVNNLSKDVIETLKDVRHDNNLTALLDLSKQPTNIQSKVSTLLSSNGQNHSIKTALKAIFAKNNLRKLKKNKKYSILYADPPWSYDGESMHNERGRSKTGNAEAHYPTLGIDKLKEWNIPDICNENSILFMWVISPFLDVGIELGKSWGFEYKTIAFVWDKSIPIPGYYTMGQCEVCLLFKKGNIPQPRGDRNIKQYYEKKKTRHSEKPEEFRKRIEKMFPEHSKIELFARSKNKGWDVFGNQIK